MLEADQQTGDENGYQGGKSRALPGCGSQAWTPSDHKQGAGDQQQGADEPQQIK